MAFSLIDETQFGGSSFRHHRLHNGLGVLFVADHRSPIVTYQTWMNVGSRHEFQGATGLAHFFEHLMFHQTKTHPAGAFDRIIERSGGDSNAATWLDWTYYRDSVPARDLETIVALEADRMQNLALVPAAFLAERDVVKNERMQRVDDDVDGFADEECFRLAFSRHPYGWPTIGWMKDIESLTQEHAEAFYRRFYTPANATVVVVGDVKEDQLLALIEKHYGHFPATEIVYPPYEKEPPLTAPKVAEFTKPTAQARVILAFHSPPQSDPSWAACSIVASILGTGGSSRLHKRLVAEQELAAHVSCELLPLRDAGLFRISSLATEGTKPQQILDAIWDEVNKLKSAGITAEELNKIKNMAQTDFWLELDSIGGLAEALGHYQTAHGDFKLLFSTAQRLADVTAEEVTAAARTICDLKKSVSVIVHPEHESQQDEGAE